MIKFFRRGAKVKAQWVKSLIHESENLFEFYRVAAALTLGAIEDLILGLMSLRIKIQMYIMAGEKGRTGKK